jgi:ABC-2 type transport system permease protein
MVSRGFRNTWIIFKHEYLKRVRTRSFLITTSMMPFFMAVIVGLPALAGRTARAQIQHVVLVCADPKLAGPIQESISRATKGTYQVKIVGDASAAQRERLLGDLNANRIDGYIWMDSDALASGDVTYARRNVGDLMGQQTVRAAISEALSHQRLAEKGVSLADSDRMLKGIDLDAVMVGGGKERQDRSLAALLTVFLIVLVLFVTLLSYGVMVMRSVMEEKASRVMEILLCSATAEELMGGKILGVGAVGLTQVIAWAAMGFLIASPKVPGGASLHIPSSFIAYFLLFYLLGYVLYSAMFAAVGAAFNSTDEAQQWTFVIISPLIVAATLMTPVAVSPNSGMAVVASMIPFCAPVLMYLRIVAERPPAWQILLCVLLLIITTIGALRVGARVYRVGILMYGKRPTLREMLKWLRYA